MDGFGAAAATSSVLPSIAGNELTPAGACADQRSEPSRVLKAYSLPLSVDVNGRTVYYWTIPKK